jgi:hypothetical protein
VNDEAARQSRLATSLNSPELDDTSEPARIPVLRIEFELEGGAKVMNSRDLTSAEIVRLVDWISNRATFPGLAAWADRLLTAREEWAA